VWCNDYGRGLTPRWLSVAPFGYAVIIVITESTVSWLKVGLFVTLFAARLPLVPHQCSAAERVGVDISRPFVTGFNAHRQR